MAPNGGIYTQREERNWQRCKEAFERVIPAIYRFAFARKLKVEPYYHGDANWILEWQRRGLERRVHIWVHKRQRRYMFGIMPIVFQDDQRRLVRRGRDRVQDEDILRLPAEVSLPEFEAALEQTYKAANAITRQEMDTESPLATPPKTENPQEEAQKAFKTAGTLVERGHPDSAIAELTRAIELKPDYADAYGLRGALYDMRGADEAALQDFTTAIRLKPDYAAAYYNRGVAYSYKGEHDQAIADYTRAIELRPDYAEAYNNRGNAYGRKGDYDGAIADFTRAIELRPNLAEAYYNRAVAYAHLDRQPEVRADLAEAVRLKPELAPKQQQAPAPLQFRPPIHVRERDLAYAR